MKSLIILFGVVFILGGILLTFGILIYSLKEDDPNGYKGFFLSGGLITFGIYCLIKGFKIKK